MEMSSPPADEHQFSGIVQSIDGSTLTLVNRAGDLIKVDGGPASANFQAAPPAVGRAILVRGTVDEAGVVHATTLLRAKNSAQSWQPDR
jgi:hypothetical protein